MFFFYFLLYIILRALPIIRELIKATDVEVTFAKINDIDYIIARAITLVFYTS